MIEQKPDAPVIDAPGGDPNQAPWTAQQTFRAVLLTLIPWIAFSLMLNATGSNTAPSKPLATGEDLAGAFIAFIFTALIEGAFLIAPYHYANRALREVQSRRRAVFQALGLRRFQIGRTLLWVVGLMILIFAFDWLYSYAITALHLHIQTNDQVVLQESATQPLTVYGLLAGSILIAPFCEEIFFRGFVFTGLLRELSPVWAIIISASLFAIAHADPSSFLPLFVIGIALGYLRWRSGSTWAGISLHMLNNLLSSVLIILAMHNVNLPF